MGPGLNSKSVWFRLGSEYRNVCMWLFGKFPVIERLAERFRVSNMSITCNTAVPSTFEKLSGASDYLDWSYAMEIHLVNCDLWEAVTGEVRNDKKDRRALATIVSGVQTHISSPKSGSLRHVRKFGSVWRAFMRSKGSHVRLHWLRNSCQLDMLIVAAWAITSIARYA